MRLLPSAWIMATSIFLLSGACASGKIINSGPEGSGGTNGDASIIRLDVTSMFVNLDTRASNRVGSDAPPGPNCGNGELTKDEACDDGNNESGDGCANNCLSVEPGYSCVTPGKPCRPVARCGRRVGRVSRAVRRRQQGQRMTAARTSCRIEVTLEVRRQSQLLLAYHLRRRQEGRRRELR